MKRVAPFLPIFGAAVVSVMVLMLRVDPTIWWAARDWTPVWFILGGGFIFFSVIAIHTVGSHIDDFLAKETKPLRDRIAALELDARNESRERESNQALLLARANRIVELETTIANTELHIKPAGLDKKSSNRSLEARQDRWKEDLETLETCPVKGCRSFSHQQKRTYFYQVPHEFADSAEGKTLLSELGDNPMVCLNCFERLFHQEPEIRYAYLRVWRDNLPCAIHNCGEDATGIGADNKNYCRGHISRSGPVKEATIT